MSTAAADGQIAGTRRARAGAGPKAAGVILLIVGVMFLFVAILLGSLCFIGGGIICEGTMIGTIAFVFFMMGAVPLLFAIMLLAIGRRMAASAAAAGFDDATDAVASSVTAAKVSLEVAEPLEPAAPSQPVSLNCPECGAPVKRGAPVCTYCGQTFA